MKKEEKIETEKIEKKSIKRGTERRFHWRTVLLFVVVIVLGWLVFQVFFSYEDCKSRQCFDENLRDCDKAKFVAGEDMIFEYVIKGKGGGGCEVSVELLQGELNNADSRKLEGQKMLCTLPLGVVMNPESDVGVCHGLLKEGLQDLIIAKLHTYLVQNLGRLNLEMLGIPEV
ncbi:hypothetical protein K8R30_03905 [archaeon]|nr:hypothetical protein [archaeon]